MLQRLVGPATEVGFATLQVLIEVGLVAADLAAGVEAGRAEVVEVFARNRVGIIREIVNVSALWWRKIEPFFEALLHLNVRWVAALLHLEVDENKLLVPSQG